MPGISNKTQGPVGLGPWSAPSRPGVIPPPRPIYFEEVDFVGVPPNKKAPGALEELMANFEHIGGQTPVFGDEGMQPLLAFRWLGHPDIAHVDDQLVQQATLDRGEI